jgi:hypothetical protein
MTVFLCAVSGEHLHKIKHICNFTKNWMLAWFPEQPTYQQFNARLNFLFPASQALVAGMLTANVPAGCDFENSLIDSFPTVTCKGRNRQAKWRVKLPAGVSVPPKTCIITA